MLAQIVQGKATRSGHEDFPQSGHRGDHVLRLRAGQRPDPFAFQCGYCTAGFLNEGQVLLERLAKAPVKRADLENTIAEALDGHICRCTGYIKYYEAVRDVILADSKRYLAAQPMTGRENAA